jgi:hypothetical protein
VCYLILLWTRDQTDLASGTAGSSFAKKNAKEWGTHCVGNAREIKSQATRRLVISISASASDEFFVLSTAESALAGIAALVPVRSRPELSHKRRGGKLGTGNGR